MHSCRKDYRRGRRHDEEVGTVGLQPAGQIYAYESAPLEFSVAEAKFEATSVQMHIARAIVEAARNAKSSMAEMHQKMPAVIAGTMQPRYNHHQVVLLVLKEPRRVPQQTPSL